MGIRFGNRVYVQLDGGILSESAFENTYDGVGGAISIGKRWNSFHFLMVAMVKKIDLEDVEYSRMDLYPMLGFSL